MQMDGFEPSTCPMYQISHDIDVVLSIVLSIAPNRIILKSGVFDHFTTPAFLF